MSKEHARSLRKNLTEAENRMWYYLRSRRLNGYKFVRQYAIGNYIVDFICREKDLIVEIDGGQHMTAIDYDEQRSNYLESRGYRIFRVWNHEVFNNIQGVMEAILSLIEGGLAKCPHPRPFSRKAGEGSFKFLALGFKNKR